MAFTCPMPCAPKLATLCLTRLRIAIFHASYHVRLITFNGRRTPPATPPRARGGEPMPQANAYCMGGASGGNGLKNGSGEVRA